MTLDESQRRRAMRPEVRDSREALVLTRPLARRIGQWQAVAAKIAAQVAAAQVKGKPDSSLRDNALELLDLVAAERRALVEGAARLPPRVAANWRIIDTGKALGSLASSLENALRAIESGPPRPAIERINGSRPPNAKYH